MHMHAHRCGCTGPPGSCAGLCKLGPGSSLALPACPSHLPRVPGARWGQAGPETSPSCCAQFQGSHPLASCLQSLPALASVPWASRKAPRGPLHSPACLSPPPRPTQCRGCATYFLPHLQSPSPWGPEEHQAEQSVQGESTKDIHTYTGPSETVSAYSGHLQGLCTANI